MNPYLVRLQAEYGAITEGIEAVLERAATENRDLSDAENAQIERDDKRRTELQAAIDVQAGIIERSGKVRSVLERTAGVVPGPSRTTTSEPEPEFDLAREIGGEGSVGDYVALVHRAWVKRDKAAIDVLERATAHQLLADNPGIVPKPIVAPVVDRMRAMRPLVASLGAPKTPPGPKFDRPLVTQHVAVGAQATEKDLTASQKMIVTPVEVTLQTHAGHLNISKQDVRWSQPSILSLVYDSFGKVYARVSDRAACSTFNTKVTQTQEVSSAAGTWTQAAIDEALGAAAGTIGGADGDNGELNHAWLSRDMAVMLAGMRNPNTGQKLYNIPLVNGTTGDIDGIPTTIDPRFAAGTWIVGDDTLVEFWEDLEGFLTVDEPDVLGQLVGFAGYNALAVLDPTGFVKLTNAVVATATAKSKS